MSAFNAELTLKVVASAFRRGEVENELQRIGMTDFILSWTATMRKA